MNLSLELREQIVLKYDTEKFPFRGLIAAALQIPEDDLGNLHQTPEGRLFAARFAPDSPLRHKPPARSPFAARWLAHLSSDRSARLAFDRLLASFAREVCAPALGCAGLALVYQQRPTLRFHLPGTAPLGTVHRDADYYHQPNEVNFWVPLSRCFGSNSLAAESRPGAADFRFFEADYGQCVRFWGNQVLHYTVLNETETTRVSFDLRVVPAALFIPSYIAPGDNEVRFRIGAYFKSSAADDEEEAEDPRGDERDRVSGSVKCMRGGRQRGESEGRKDEKEADEGGILEGEGMQGLWDGDGERSVGAVLF